MTYDNKYVIISQYRSLQENNNKSNNIKFNKIISYMRRLQKDGLRIGELYIKHLSNDIWELRPLRDRILFAYYDKNTFILLNIFIKTTRKTPKTEIEKAKKLLKDWSDRNEKWKMGNVGGV